MFKHLYSRFLQSRGDVLHMAPHSHYYWPDVTRDAQLAYWDDAAKAADDKWDYIFSRKLPAVQKGIAERLNLNNPGQIVFAPNTHEFVYRLFSCFDPARPLRILTTDSEFHSFQRQLRRLQERANVDVTVIATEPFNTLAQRWRDAVVADTYDMIFISQVFFNSGVAAPEVNEWLDAVASEKTMVVIDGYHGFSALPTDLSASAQRIFYLAGGYKYAQAGEGCCFMVVPENSRHRPEYTGWFADFASLAKPQQGPVGYAPDGFRFAGSTMDYTALYRFAAVIELWQQQGLTVERVNLYIRELQKGFLEHLDSLQHPLLNRDHLLCNDMQQHGHFLTFRLDSSEQVSHLAGRLREQGVHTDYRHDRLRFGFALYHEVSDYTRICG